ncbi:FUSC family protein [Sphingobium sp. EM0848]|uniref:FUSC family protein n=1 Tax=Sphingobium sp. EM0848 TaxID=2743473 RepID=UPI0021014062|nr:FUSC family protein [Sphingobium sp. EM0848]
MSPGAVTRFISARTVDEAECVASVLLAIALAHGLGAVHVSWAAFAGYMVMRGHAGETLVRGLLRIAGTVAGGMLALLVAPLVLPSLPLITLAMLVAATVSLYGALTGKRSYAWLFFGLTFVMLLFDRVEHPDIALPSFVATRILETSVGTLACVTVSLASTLTLRRRWPGSRTPPPQRLGWHGGAFRHALQTGVAVGSLAVLHALIAIPAPTQGAIAAMAVMMMPAAGIGGSGLVPVSRRILHRVLGGVAGAVLAAAVLLIAHGSPAVLIAGTVAGVLLGRHLENGDHGYRYVGTQFTLAVLVALVPDSYGDAAIAPALERLAGTLIGMAALAPVLLGWHWFSPDRPRPSSLSREEAGGI